MCAWCICSSRTGEGYWVIWNLSHEFPLLSEISNHKEKECVQLPFFSSLIFFNQWRIVLPSSQSHSHMLFLYITQFYTSSACKDAPSISSISNCYHSRMPDSFLMTLITCMSSKVVIANPLERTVVYSFSCFSRKLQTSVSTNTCSSWLTLGPELGRRRKGRTRQLNWCWRR